MPWSIGDTYSRTITNNGVTLRVRWEVTAIAAPSPDDDPDGPRPIDGTPIEFCLIDRRTPEQIADWEHLYNDQQLDLAAQYISADPDNPTYHAITNPMKRFFRFGDATTLGAKRR